MSLDIDGWGVAQPDLERSWSGRELRNHCWLFRSLTTWTLVTTRRSVRYDDYDQPSAGKATISSRAFPSLEELAQEVERTYSAGAWVELLNGGYEQDADLYRVFIRLDPEAVAGPLFQPVPDEGGW